MEKVMETPLQFTQKYLQCGQTGKSAECAFVNMSDVVEGQHPKRRGRYYTPEISNIEQGRFAV